jgi:hypothetical protein
VLARLGTVPAVLLAGWLVAAYPLARVGLATPVPAVLLAGAVVAAMLVASRGQRPIPHTPWWAVLAVIAIAVVFGLLAATRHAEPVVLRRDPGVYAVTAHWLASHGGLALPSGLVGPGAPGSVLTAASPGFYLQDGTVVPQFMSGPAIGLLPGGWLGGWAGIGMLVGVYAAAALLAVAGLTARLVGPRWAPLAALALGLSQPQLLAARTTLSEPLSQLVLFGALCLLVDSAGPPGAPAGAAGPAGPVARRGAERGRGLAALSGLLFGLGILLRFDAVRELLLLIPVLGWLAARRRPQWVWLAGGVLAGAAFGLADALGPSRSYVLAVLYLLRPALAAGPVLLAGTVGAVLLIRRYGVPARLRDGLALAGAAAVVTAAGFLWARPWLQVSRQQADDSTPILAGMQQDQHLPVDGTRTYAEQSLRWLSWYVGWIAIALAVVAAAFGVRAALRGRADRWALALPVPLGSAVLVLYRPGITPDHPWADRRLVPTVLPTVLLLAVAAVAAGSRTLRRQLRRPPALPVADQPPGGLPGGSPGRRWLVRLAPLAVAVAGAAVLVVPTAAAARPLLTAHTEAGEPAAVETACAAFGPGDVALAIDARSRQELVPALRLVCEVPTYGVPGEPTDATATRAQVDAAVRQVRETGGHPVLVAQSAVPLPTLASAPQRRVAELATTEHERVLTQRPTRLAPLRVEIWVAAAD